MGWSKAERRRRSWALGWAQLVIAVVLLLVTAVVAGGATSRSVRAKAVSPQIVSTRKLAHLGTVLVNGHGLTLYMFVPDQRRRVACVQQCAVIWPPMKLAKGQKVIVKGQAKRSLLGSDPNPAGGRVVTYAGWPLYTYVVDRAPGQINGQALYRNAGLWYVLSPTGKVIRTKP